MLIKSYAYFVYNHVYWFFDGKEGLIGEYLKRKEFLDNTDLDNYCRGVVGVLKGIILTGGEKYIDFFEFIDRGSNRKNPFEMLQEAVEELKKETDRDPCEIRKLLLMGVPPLAIVGYKKPSTVTEFDALLYLKRIEEVDKKTEMDLIEILQSKLAG